MDFRGTFCMTRTCNVKTLCFTRVYYPSSSLIPWHAITRLFLRVLFDVYAVLHPTPNVVLLRRVFYKCIFFFFRNKRRKNLHKHLLTANNKNTTFHYGAILRFFLHDFHRTVRFPEKFGGVRIKYAPT